MFATANAFYFSHYSYDAVGNLLADKQEEIDHIEWTISGKVHRVIRTALSQKPDLEFEYDASGNRIVKKVIKKNGDVVSTYYLRDATGNVMSVYSYSSTDNDPAVSEQYLYGSSRLGVYTPPLTVLSNNTRSFGRKSYEISDHLGNVRVTLLDYRRSVQTQKIQSATDYYPFGMVARSYVGPQMYRYGFNGKEKINDLTGDGVIYDFDLRNYDSRIGRMWKIDPKTSKYPWQSPFAYHRNSPIAMIDYLGGGDNDDKPKVTNTEVKTKGDADKSITSKSQLAAQVGLGNGIKATVVSDKGTFTEIANARQVSFTVEGIDLSNAKLVNTDNKLSDGEFSAIIETDKYTIKLKRTVVAQKVTKDALDKYTTEPKVGDDSPSAEFYGIVPNGSQGGIINIYDAPAIKQDGFPTGAKMQLFQANFTETLIITDKVTGEQIKSITIEWSSQIMVAGTKADGINVLEVESLPTQSAENHIPFIKRN